MSDPEKTPYATSPGKAEADADQSQGQDAPGSDSQPQGQSPDYAKPDAAARTSSNAPPATNQPKAEPMPADEAQAAPGPGNISTTNPQSPNAVSSRRGAAGGPAEHGHGGDPGTGNAHGVSVASTDTMAGSSEDEEPWAPAVGQPETKTATDRPAGISRPGRSAAPDGEVSST